jgi:hypothetical protein
MDDESTNHIIKKYAKDQLDLRNIQKENKFEEPQLDLKENFNCQDLMKEKVK